MSAKVIGSVTTYHGDEHPHLRGSQVKVVAIFKGAARADYDPDDGSRLTVEKRRTRCDM